LSREEIQSKVEQFLANYQSEDELVKEEAWLIGQELFDQFYPLVLGILFGKRGRIQVDSSVWNKTIKKEGSEDMISEAKVQFFEALCDYDPESGVYFPYYIQRKLQYGVFNTLRKNGFDHALREISLDEYLATATPVTGTKGRVLREITKQSRGVEDILFPDAPVNSLLLRVAWNSLSKKQKDVLDLTLQRNYTLREAGETLGIHFTTVRGIRKRSLSKMKKIIKSTPKKPTP
jgi:RNA polymerase sigma factor (sigma-70 family)